MHRRKFRLYCSATILVKAIPIHFDAVAQTCLLSLECHPFSIEIMLVMMDVCMHDERASVLVCSSHAGHTLL